MKKALTVIPMIAVLVVTLVGLNAYSERKHSKDILEDPLYIGVMNGTTGEYIYISNEEDMKKVVEGAQKTSTQVFNMSTGYTYYVDIFSGKMPGDSMRYTIDGTCKDLASRLKGYYDNSSSYKKDRIYIVQNMSAGHNYQIKLRYTDTDGYDSNNKVITVSNEKAVEKILSYLKDIRFKYDKNKLSEGSKRCWIQMYYDNKQIMHEEFTGSKVIKNDGEYVVANPDIVNSLYSYIHMLEDKGD